MALLVAGRAVCRSAAARLANMVSVDDPASSVNGASAPKPHPATGENRTRRADEQAQIPAKRAMPRRRLTRAFGVMAGTEL
jgi:hypothetical protein